MLQQKSLTEQLPLEEKTVLLPWLKRLLLVVEPRLAVLEEDRLTEQSTIDLIRDTALDRVNEVITPLAVEASERLREFSKIFFTGSVTPVTPGIGDRLWVITEGTRSTFASLGYIVATHRGNPASGMMGKVASYDAGSGTLIVDVRSTWGDQGAWADWDITATLPIDYHVGRLDNPHAVTAEQVGAYTKAASDTITSALARAIQANTDELAKRPSDGGNATFTNVTTNGTALFNGLVKLLRQSTGDALAFGDDALMGDVDVPNAVGLRGAQTSTAGYLALGSGKKRLGFDGGNMIAEVGGNFYIKPDGASQFFGAWHSGNFNPDVKASLGVNVRFSGISLGTGDQGYIYSDTGAANFAIRTGSSASGYRYAVFQADGSASFSSTLQTSGDITVNKTYPCFRFYWGGVRDIAWQLREDARVNLWDYTGNRSLFSVGPSGDVYTVQFGDLNNRIEDRAAAHANAAAAGRLSRTGDTSTGDITIQKTYPSTILYYPGYLRAGWQVREDYKVHWINFDSGAIYFSIGTNGAVNTSQFGDLNQRIEDRASAYAGAVSGPVIFQRLSDAGRISAGYEANCLKMTLGDGRMQCLDSTGRTGGLVVTARSSRIGGIAWNDQGYMELLLDNTGIGFTPNVSDKRIKKNIKTRKGLDELAKIARLRFVSFDFTEESFMSGSRSLGLIAQEAEKIDPEWILRPQEDEGLRMLNLQGLLLSALSALNQANDKITALEERVAAMETK